MLIWCERMGLDSGEDSDMDEGVSKELIMMLPKKQRRRSEASL